MIIFGIETSCDETSAAAVKDGRKILSNVISSQIKIHRPFSGVVPELASRAHIENVNWVIEAALRDAGLSLGDIPRKIDAIAYTRGPGLAGALLVGQMAAQTLSTLYKVPLVDVNHLEGHLFSALLEHRALKPPFLCLIVSGGHTELVIVKDYGRYQLLGGTRDDAAGEAYDKVAKLLKLGYPGGPVIDRMAKKGNPKAIAFPRPYLWGTWDFSFSGLKTAVVNFVKKQENMHTNRLPLPAVCASFQQAVVDTLVEKTFAAAKEYDMKTIVLGGGVSANSQLRRAFTSRGKQERRAVLLPALELCTDNAAMIACAGYYRFIQTKAREQSAGRIEPGLALQNW